MMIHELSKCALYALLVVGIAAAADNSAPPTGKPGGRPVPVPSPSSPTAPKQTNPPPKAPAPKSPTPTAPVVPNAPAVTAPIAPAPATPAQVPAKPVVTSVDGLDATPLEIEPLGLRFRPPVNCVMRTDGVGASAQWVVTERAESPRFILRISRLVAGDDKSSPAKQIDEYIKAMTERPNTDGSVTVFSVRDRRALQVGTCPAGLVYASIREADAVDAVRGYLLIQVSPTDFVVMSILVAEEDFASIAPLLEKSIQSIEFLGAEHVLASRQQRLARGDEFLRHLDEDSLRTALDPVAKPGTPPAKRWYRIARKLTDGTEVEVGYLTVMIMEGPQGAANPDRPQTKWDASEQEPGLLVHVQVRVLLDEKGSKVADTEGRYWMRWDRQREFWTSRTTQRMERKQQSSTQLGVRESPTPRVPRPVLEIADARSGELASNPRRLQVPESAYLSLAEAMVLPRLLVREGEAGDYGFNWFDPRSNKPAQRRDVLQKTPTGWQLETQSALEVSPSIQRLGPRGEMLRQDGEDGGFTEAIEPEALLKLWRSKGLPTG